MAIEVGQGLKGDDVVRTLNRLKLEGVVPQVPFCDNVSEVASQEMNLIGVQDGVKIDFSLLGKPTDNAFVESFNGTFRAGLLDIHWFADMKAARALIGAWRQECNESRPDISPAEA